MLKVTSEGGFINPAAHLATLPTVAVYADGRIFTPGAIDSIFPGPLVPPVVVRAVGPSGAATILAAIKLAGLDRAATSGPGIPGDSGTNVFTTVVDDTTTTTRLAGGGPPGPGSASGDPERTAALELLSRLLDPAETWGAASAPEAPFVPTAYRIYVAPGAPANNPAVSQTRVAWPLATDLDTFGLPAQPNLGIAGLRVGVVLDGEAAQLAPILRAANAATPFTSGGKSYTLFVRPLLPDEIGG